eukprot:5596323-Pyramimonas_sp.AAC.1
MTAASPSKTPLGGLWRRDDRLGCSCEALFGEAECLSNVASPRDLGGDVAGVPHDAQRGAPTSHDVAWFAVEEPPLGTVDVAGGTAELAPFDLELDLPR